MASCFAALVALLILMFLQATLASDKQGSIRDNEYFYLNEKLLSPDNSFEFGLTASEQTPGEFYAMIRFSSSKTTVWTAKGLGSRPLSANVRIVLNAQGLSVMDNDEIQQVIANCSSSDCSVAEMQNSGNLVLKSSNGLVVWQSFDSPTDTLLPNQFLKGSQSLQSGNYVLQLTDTTAQLKYIAVPGSNFSAYWTFSGASAGTGKNQSTLMMSSSGILTFTDSNNSSQHKDAIDFSFAAATRVTRRLTLERKGNLQMHSLSESNSSWTTVWQAVLQECQIHGTCGPFGVCSYAPKLTCICPPGFHFVDPNDRSKGCSSDIPLRLNCNSSRHDYRWVRLDRSSYDDNDFIEKKNLGPVSLDKCKSRCLKDCRCLGIVYRVDRHASCYLKGARNPSAQVLYNGHQIPSGDELASVVYLKVAPSSSILEAPLNQLFNMTLNTTNVPDVRKLERYQERFTLAIPVALVVAEAVLFLAVGVIWWFYVQGRMKQISQALEVDGAVMRFTYRQLEVATSSFKDKLGSGAFGTVFTAVIPDGTVVAVKNLEMATHAEKQFMAEVGTLGKIHHMNLVRLLGYCAEGSHRLLVYEYMPNGSLEKVLFSAKENKVDEEETVSGIADTLSDWKTRFSIALGISRGITYLHEQCQECIIHCDIKPQNILLDENFRPKVGDFGLAKLTKRETAVNVTTVRGTRGYMAPEWASNVTVTPKVDVYSYGMVLLELMSGRDKFLFTPSAMQTGRWYFPAWAFQQYTEGDMHSIADPRMVESIDWEEFDMTLKVAFWCIQPDPEFRPIMSKVVQMLEKNVPVAEPPRPRILNDEQETDTKCGELSVCPMYPSESGR